MYNTSLFIFRRDLRLVDNTAWLKCSKYSKKIIPCFIINPEQVGSSNRFRSDPCIQFMIESLEDLDKELKKIWWKTERFIWGRRWRYNKNNKKIQNRCIIH